jgi:hypothetical protein
MHGRLESVDPIERTFDRMPTRNLTENIHGIDDAPHFDHDELSF